MKVKLRNEKLFNEPFIKGLRDTLVEKGLPPGVKLSLIKLHKEMIKQHEDIMELKKTTDEKGMDEVLMESHEYTVDVMNADQVIKFLSADTILRLDGVFFIQ